MRANRLAGAVLCVGMALAMAGCKGLLVNVEETDDKTAAPAATTKHDISARVASLESRMLTLEATVRGMQQPPAQK